MAGRGQGGRGQNGASIPKAPTESKPLEKRGRSAPSVATATAWRRGEKLERMERTRADVRIRRAERSHRLDKSRRYRSRRSRRIRSARLRSRRKLTISELGEAMKVQPGRLQRSCSCRGTMVTVTRRSNLIRQRRSHWSSTASVRRK